MNKRTLLMLITLSVLLPVSAAIYRPGRAAENPAVRQGNSNPSPESQRADEKETERSDESKTERRKFMRGKLAMVNRIVEGLNTENFDMIREGCRDLSVMAQSASWTASQDPFYQHYSHNFEQAVRGLLEAADSRSPEKATFAYIHVTVTCMTCHQHVRGTLRVAE
ncbi:MAG: hypothetical protein KDA89_18810 [Planctomycetaceae bacterium]|nr:hypothetical protein [Planctomycetaceae bacterium]